jgi:hypothetical protein
MAILNGTYVYVRAIATNKVRHYENGVDITVPGTITIAPIDKEGHAYDYLLVPSDTVISASAAEWAIRKRIENESK